MTPSNNASTAAKIATIAYGSNNNRERFWESWLQELSQEKLIDLGLDSNLAIKKVDISSTKREDWQRLVDRMYIFLADSLCKRKNKNSQSLFNATLPDELKTELTTLNDVLSEIALDDEIFAAYDKKNQSPLFPALFNKIGEIISKLENKKKQAIKQEQINRDIFLLEQLKERFAILMLLQKKAANYTQKLIVDSLTQYQLDEDEKQKVMYAILTGNLALTDLIKRGFRHAFWSLISFKWGNLFKQLSRNELLQKANAAWECRLVERTNAQNRQRFWRGVFLAAGKIITSMALCFVFAIGVLVEMCGCPTLIAYVIGAVLALCNGIVCATSRGTAMLDCTVRDLNKRQKTYKTVEENSKNKAASRWAKRIIVGIFTLVACAAAGATAWTGLTGFVAYLAKIGIAISIFNPYVLAAVIGLTVVAAISFYAFQASGIEACFDHYGKLILDAYKKGWSKLGLLLLVSAVFFVVYGVITLFTVATGISKILDFCNVKNRTLEYTLIGIATVTTIFVNMCSQVLKVVNPANWVTLVKEANKFVCGSQTQAPRTWWDGIKHAFKVAGTIFMLLCNDTAYSGFGGIKSGTDVSSGVANLLGGGSTVWMFFFVILSPIVLFLVSLAFTYPPVLKCIDGLTTSKSTTNNTPSKTANTPVQNSNKNANALNSLISNANSTKTTTVSTVLPTNSTSGRSSPLSPSSLDSLSSTNQTTISNNDDTDRSAHSPLPSARSASPESTRSVFNSSIRFFNESHPNNHLDKTIPHVPIAVSA